MPNDESHALVAAKPLDTVRQALERLKPQLAMALPKHLSPDRLVRVAMTAVQRTPKLLECDRTSFYGAVMMCAQLGLEPDGVLGQAYIIPFKGKAQFIPGYKGLLALARNSGEVSYIAAHEVRENDDFEFDFASGDPPKHKFDLKQDRGEVIAFYAIARFRDGSFHWDMMTRAEVDRIRDSSSGYIAALATAKKYDRAPDSPWIEHYVEMGRKSAIRRLAKYLPLSVQKAAEIDAQVSAGMHVTLDRYGDIVIEGEATPADEAAAATEKKTSKLERFEEAQSGGQATTEAETEAGESSAEGQEQAESGTRESTAEAAADGPRRSEIWNDASYDIGAPERDLAGAANWRQWVDKIAYLCSEAATPAELAKLKKDNGQHLTLCRREAGDEYRRANEALADREKALAA